MKAIFLIALTFATQSFASVRFWSPTNPIFHDLNGDGVMDFNNKVTDKARNEWGIDIPLSSLWFKDLKVGVNIYGYFFSAFIDTTTYRSYCIRKHNAEPVKRILGELLGINTQAFYALEKVNGRKDRIFLTEKELKSAWFILRNGYELPPMEDEVTNNRVYYRRGRDMFRLLSPEDLGLSGNISSNGYSTHYPAHDHKIGCVSE